MIDPFWNLAHKLYQLNLRLPARFFELISMMISSHAVSAQITIGKGSKFWHHGLGSVVLQSTHIGDNCIIFQNVTIGKSFSARTEVQNRGGICNIGNNCIIGAGAVILGSVTIGNNVKIGANAVVTHDIPSNSVAMGVPARLKTQNI